MPTVNPATKGTSQVPDAEARAGRIAMPDLERA
jgi:hypothetical protein